MASAAEGKASRKLRSTSGAGVSRRLTTAMAARVPNEPIMSLAMSRPATFFTTMPPDCTSLPSTVAKRIPITMSRAVP